jgi:hypothetical protein
MQSSQSGSLLIWPNRLLINEVKEICIYGYYRPNR